MKKFKLRKHQKKQNKMLDKSITQYEHTLYGAAAGFGKSVVMWDIIRRDLKKGRKVLVTAPYRKLIFQLAETFSEYQPAILMGSNSRGNTKSQLVLGSLDTISTRMKKDINLLGDLDRIYIDEAHISFNIEDDEPQKRISLLYNKYWNTSTWVGFTATPINPKGYRLEGWDNCIYPYQTGWLIKKGFLSEYKYLAPEEMDLSKLSVDSRTQEYAAEDVDREVTSAVAISSVIKNYKKFASNKKTLIFAASIKHAELIKKAFKGKAEVIHSKIPEKQQGVILQDFSAGKFTVLINVNMLTTGYDEPSIECLLIARPIKSIRTGIQVFGRSLRTHENIPTVSILDLCSVYKNVGLPCKLRDFNKEKPTKDDVIDKKEKDNEKETIKCPHCLKVVEISEIDKNVEVTKKSIITTKYCPECGGVMDEDLKLLQKTKKLKKISKEKNKKVSRNDMKNFLTYLSNYKGFKGGWVYYKMKMYDEYKTEMSLIYNKLQRWDIKEETAIRNLNKMGS